VDLPEAEAVHGRSRAIDRPDAGYPIDGNGHRYDRFPYFRRCPVNSFQRFVPVGLISLAVAGCSNSSSSDPHVQHAKRASVALTAEQICSRLTSDEIAQAIERTVVRKTSARTLRAGTVTYICTYHFGESGRDQIEVIVALQGTSLPSLSAARWPRPLHIGCESVGAGANEVGGCDAILPHGVRATVLGKGGVLTAAAAESLVAALLDSP
jgi:hypothetical protein